jgi:hypothetical protein
MAHTLYLVSAEDKGLKYWKIGITKHADPLKRDRKKYQEVFRAVRFDVVEDGEDDDDAWFVESVMKDALKRIGCPVGTESIDYAASLESVTSLFDQFVRWHEENLLCHIWPASSEEEHIESKMEWVEESKTWVGRFENAEASAKEDILRYGPLWRKCDELVQSVLDSIQEACVEVEQKEIQPMWA